VKGDWHGYIKRVQERLCIAMLLFFEIREYSCSFKERGRGASELFVQTPLSSRSFLL
jgi:hypothetical protein